MGYSLHITRAEEWFDSEREPIAESEWLRVADASPDLGRTGVIAYDTPTFFLREHPDVTCHFYRGGVDIDGMKAGAIPVLRKLANELLGNLVGDDGEEY